MSIYQRLAKISTKIIPQKKMFKHGFNLSPMYRRSTARVIDVSDDLHEVRVKLKISWKNRNYVNSIFGGSMFSAVDPIPMVQLINILGPDYVVWDKSAEVRFKRPAKEHLYAQFTYTEEEVADIKRQVAAHQEIEIHKLTALTNHQGDTVFCEVNKLIYVADKSFYREKRKRKTEKNHG